MASTGGDARSKRAKARGERRAKASTTQQGRQQEQHEEQRSEGRGGDDGGNGGTSVSTPKLVAAGAAAGALLGTAKAVMDRRHGHDAGDEEQDEHEEQEQEPRGRSEREQTSSEQPTGVRGLLVTVLEAALEAVNEPGQGRQQHEQGDEEPARQEDEEEDDDESDREPRGEHEDGGRPTARGNGVEVGRGEGQGAGGPDTGAGEAGGDGDDEESEGTRTPQAIGEDAAAVEDEDVDVDDTYEAHEAPIPHRNGGVGAAQVLARGREQIAALVGREPESASRVEQVDGGWRLAFEVVEVPRIPSTTDVLASYDVALDESGDLVEYARTRRYYRNRAEGEG